MEQRLEELLEAGIERVVWGGEPLEAFLAAHPEARAELEPLLRVALATRRAAAVELSPAFRAALGNRLMAAGHRQNSPRPWWLRLRRRQAAALAAAVVLIFGGFGVAAASAQSLPDEPLYPLKRSLEQVQLALAFRPRDKARQLVQLTQRRSEEQARLVALGRVERFAELEEERAGYLNQIADLAQHFSSDDAEDVAQTLAKNQQHHLEVLAEVLEKAPPQARPGLERALEVSRRGYQEAQEAVERRRGPEEGPGRRVGPPTGVPGRQVGPPQETPEPTTTPGRRVGPPEETPGRRVGPPQETPEPTETPRPGETPRGRR